jgi:hypothetical protein
MAGRAVLESMPLRERPAAPSAGRDVFATPWALAGVRHGGRRFSEDGMAPWGEARDGGGADSASASASASDSDSGSDGSLDVLQEPGAGAGFGRTWPPHGDAGSRSPVGRSGTGPAGPGGPAAADRLLDMPLSKRLVASIAEMGRLRCAAAAAVTGAVTGFESGAVIWAWLAGDGLGRGSERPSVRS